jgi:outer membrane protein
MRRAKVLGRLLVAAMVLGSLAVPAGAAEDDTRWLVRVRGLYVSPDEEAGIEAIGGDVATNSNLAAEADLTYFFTPNWAVELMAGTTRHNVVAEGTALGTVDLGSVWLLPPTLTLQYHLDVTERISAYLGAGGNYTLFYHDKLSGATIQEIEYDPAFGFVMQAGVDFDLSERWVLNLDVKKILLETDVSVNHGAVEADVDIDPWLFGVGVGYRF